MSLTVHTIGHSTRSLDALLALLAEHGVKLVADVRKLPRSARHPQYDDRSLRQTLPAHGISYAHLPALGGMRAPRPDSPHTALRRGPFRGYADHMETAEFAAEIDHLLRLAAAQASAVMCAEADPEHCHRKLLSDALVARGARVVHILGPGAAADHALTAGAVVRDGRVAYPGPEPRLPL